MSEQRRLGQHPTDATRQKLSQSMRLRWQNPEYRQKMIKFKIGKRHSADAIAKISAAQRGKHHSAAWCAKIGAASRGRQDSPETRAKRSAAQRRRWGAIATTPLYKRIRQNFLYRQWRSDVLKQGDYTCVICGKRDGAIHADHFPDTFSQILKRHGIHDFESALTCAELWDINNGRVLCIDCHWKHHHPLMSATTKGVTQ